MKTRIFRPILVLFLSAVMVAACGDSDADDSDNGFGDAGAGGGSDVSGGNGRSVPPGPPSPGDASDGSGSDTATDGAGSDAGDGTATGDALDGKIETDTGSADGVGDADGDSPPDDGQTDTTDPADVVDAGDIAIPIPDVTPADVGSEDIGNPGVDASTITVPDTPGCHVNLRTRLNGSQYLQVSQSTTVTLTARAKNLTDQTVALWLDDKCPNGVANFTGFPETYDIYGTCAAGQCPDLLPPKVFVIGPGEEVVLTESELALSGNQCNDALPLGIYDLLFTVDLTDDPNPTVCGPDEINPAQLSVL